MFDGRCPIPCANVKALRLLPFLIIVAAGAFVYRAAVSAYFFDDDFQWLVGTMAFQPAHLLDVGQMGHFYRPVIDLYFATSVWLHNGSPTAFHVASIALHRGLRLGCACRGRGPLPRRSDSRLIFRT